MSAALTDPARQDLIETAAAAGQPVTARTLELWRYRGLLPRPERGPGGRGNWRYPAGTDHQLLRLLHWRQQSNNHDGICVALWIEGFPIEADRVRSALAGFIDSWERILSAEINKTPGADLGALIDALATKFAAMRSRSPIPRVVRMTAAERRRAIGYLLAVMLADDSEIERRGEDRRAAERMLGLRSGHGGGLASVLKLDQDDQLVKMPSPAQARTAVAQAAVHELDFVRQLVQFMVIWLPALVPAVFGDMGDKSRPMIEIVDKFKEPPPGFFCLLAIAFLVSLRSKAVMRAELDEHAASLSHPGVDVEVLRGLPPGTRRRAYERLPADRRDSVRQQLAGQ